MGWRTAKSPLKPGRYLFLGNEACAEGAIAAGCNYFAGYPITPASEIMEYLCYRFAEMEGRVFMQMEDELASIASVIGASWAGARAMSATSGPGLSLMLENIGYAIATETPCVVVNVQRIGPSTGQPTRPTQSDVMQARWGAHGDYQNIALAPWSVAEMYSETIRAFNLTERFRVPVFLLADETVGLLREVVNIEEEVVVFDRLKAKGQPPFLGKGIAPMPAFGEGEKLLVTGSAHDEWGRRRVTSFRVQARLSEHLLGKIANNAQEIIETEALFCEDERLDVLVVAYGFTARGASAAITQAREKGMRAGLLRLKTLWPFAEGAVREMGRKAERILVPEMNQGQMVREVQRIWPEAISLPKTDGQVFTPGELLGAMREAFG